MKYKDVKNQKYSNLIPRCCICIRICGWLSVYSHTSQIMGSIKPDCLNQMLHSPQPSLLSLVSILVPAHMRPAQTGFGIFISMTVVCLPPELQHNKPPVSLDLEEG
jgi:hypothetical protein